MHGKQPCSNKLEKDLKVTEDGLSDITDVVNGRAQAVHFDLEITQEALQRVPFWTTVLGH